MKTIYNRADVEYHLFSDVVTQNMSDVKSIDMKEIYNDEAIVSHVGRDVKSIDMKEIYN